MTRVTAGWSRLPLRTQLTVAFTGLLVIGLVLSGVVALSFLERTLISQLDVQLRASAQAILDEVRHTGILDGDDTGRQNGLPSDYQVIFQDVDGNVVATRTGTSGAARPQIPGMTTAEVAAHENRAFTVSGTSDESHWRVLALNLKRTATGPIIGSMAIALPMVPAEATLRQMQLTLAGIALAVVLIGGVGAWWVVRSSLRPLRRIEDTAAAIAEGDLSRRVPPEPPSTEVGRLSGALNVMLGQIEQAFAARAASEERMRRFVADASHELRTPLATIRGYGELYRMGALPPEEHTATMRRIEESARRMGALVEDLLHLARLDENRPMRYDEVDLAVLAADAVADLHALDPDRPVRLVPLREGGTTSGAVVLGDEARLRQVVANLIGNVAQHTAPGTPAELAVGRVGEHCLLEVRDHGPGISPEHADRVFERFYRVDAARGRESGGAGLGMAIVAAIVEAHGGRVALDVTPGGGTTVRVTLEAGAPTPEGDSGHEDG
jgi:two-component system OmpR family sensor kinase